MSNRRGLGILSGFTGVALADILANGVSIIVILIVASLMVRYEQEQEKLEQAEDVSVLLSREIASSFVMNALPTSPPAVLHDYVSSPRDANPHHATMPIIELRNGYLRDYYTGTVWPRKELLAHDNGFDRYLQGLAPEQLQAMRIDVYAITEFYIAMSILKQRNHRPNHWHFLRGGGGRTGDGGSSTPARDQNLAQEAEDSGPGDGNAPIPGDLVAGASDQLAGSLPRDVALADAGGTGGRLYRGDGDGADSGTREGANGDLDLPGMGRQRSQGSTSQPLPGTGGQGAGDTKREGIRFRAAAPANESDEKLPGLGDSATSLDVLRALFAFMAQIQEETDNNLPSSLPDYRARLLEMLSRLPALADPDETRFFQGLIDWISRPIRHTASTIATGVTDDTGVRAGVRGQVVALPVNVPVKRLELLRDAMQPELEDMPYYAQLGMRLGMHPEIYEGLRVAIDLDSVIMTPPPDPQPDPDYKWRVVTLVNGKASDFITGFLYGAIDDKGRLLLPVEVNAIEIDGLRLTSYAPVFEHRSEFWRLLFFSLIALLLVLGMIGRYSRIKSLAPARGANALGKSDLGNGPATIREQTA